MRRLILNPDGQQIINHLCPYPAPVFQSGNKAGSFKPGRENAYNFVMWNFVFMWMINDYGNVYSNIRYTSASQILIYNSLNPTEPSKGKDFPPNFTAHRR